MLAATSPIPKNRGNGLRKKIGVWRAEWEHPVFEEGERSFPRRACGEAERCAADRLQMGAQPVGTRLEDACQFSEVLEVPVSTLLGEAVVEDKDEPEKSDLKVLAEKLEVVNLQLARSHAAKRDSAW